MIGMNRKKLIFPALVILAIVNFSAAVAGIIIVFIIYILNILRARLPIDPGGENHPETLIYKKAEDVELKLDLWSPPEKNRIPALVVFAHGGGWISGFRNQPNNVSWCRFLSSRGFTVASIDYRLGFKYRMSDILEDYSDAVYFIRDKFAGDEASGNIILMGLSAGGHLALSYAAYNTSQKNHQAMRGILSVIAYYAPSDLKDLYAPDDKSLFVRFAAGSTLKALPSFDEEAYIRYSPVTWLSRDMVPVLAVHGMKDETVPFRSSLTLVRRLKELGVHCRLLEHKNGGHCFEVKLRDIRTTQILEQTLRFIRIQLKNNVKNNTSG